MSISLVGQKCGMTRVFTADGESIPVTVIQVLSNRVTQVKTQANDGYNAYQLSTGVKKRSRVNKPLAGHYAKAGVEAGTMLWEVKIKDETAMPNLAAGDEIKIDVFKEGEWVDVTGISKGKGFAGCIKRHHFAAQDATHGNSLSHRAPGSIGQRQSPGKVFKGKKMSGQMGNVRCTIMSQQIVKLDLDRNLILIKGVVPGAPGGNIFIRSAVKKRQKEENK